MLGWALTRAPHKNPVLGYDYTYLSLSPLDERPLWVSQRWGTSCRCTITLIINWGWIAYIDIIHMCKIMSCKTFNFYYRGQTQRRRIKKSGTYMLFHSLVRLGFFLLQDPCHRLSTPYWSGTSLFTPRVSHLILVFFTKIEKPPLTDPTGSPTQGCFNPWPPLEQIKRLFYEQVSLSETTAPS